MTENEIEKGEHRNVSRMSVVLDALAAARQRGLRLTDIAEQTGLTKGTLHRIMAGLTSYGLVDFDAENNRYLLGMKMLSWAAASTERHGLYPFVDPHLTRLCMQTRDTIYFSILSNFDAVCVDRRDGDFPISAPLLNFGDKMPLGAASNGMALLAFQSDAFIAAALDNNEDKLRDYGFSRDFFEGELSKIRETGVAVNNGKLIEGMSGMAVPILKADGRAVATLSIAAITQRLSGERFDEIITLLKSAASEIESRASDVLNSPLAKRISKAS